MHSLQVFLLAATVATGAVAQTFSSCNPLNATCPPNSGLNQWSFMSDFTSSDAAFTYQKSWTTAAGTKLGFGSQGMTFNISSSTTTATLYSNFTFLFGRVDVVMQAAPGTGIVSSIVLQSADLDEIDIVAFGGNTTAMETNYYGKGTNNIMKYMPADAPQTKFHTYSIEWTSSSLVWSIDGSTVRTLAYSDAQGGESFPQTPMFLKIGSWDGGKPGGQSGTIAWAGGLTDFTDAPFVMYLKSVSVTNYNPANFYSYTDKTGTFGSIAALNSSSGATGSSDASEASTTTASAIVGGPTLVTATASASGTARTGSSGTSSSSDATSSKKPNTAGRTAQAASGLVSVGVILGFLSFAFAV